MPDARSILKQKSQQAIISTDPTATVTDAAHQMNNERVGSLLVMKDGTLVGIFTERDILRRVVAAGRNPDATSVSDVMTEQVACATPQTSRRELSSTMQDKCIRHVPVVDGKVVLGLISIGDLNRSENNEQAQTIRYLEQFISVG